jgi:GNAT superfamily N-acetyltransferase
MVTTFRAHLQPSDPGSIESLVRDTGFFSAEETGIARELADDGLAHGSSSHYRFILADRDGILAGYACYGPVPCTLGAWDLYWIAVAPGAQGQHLGRALLERVESAILAAGGTHIYADTSSREQYASTREFYAHRGFNKAADFPDFYAPGDGKIVYSKTLGKNGA